MTTAARKAEEKANRAAAAVKGSRVSMSRRPMTKAEAQKSAIRASLTRMTGEAGTGLGECGIAGRGEL